MAIFFDGEAFGNRMPLQRVNTPDKVTLTDFQAVSRNSNNFSEVRIMRLISKSSKHTRRVLLIVVALCAALVGDLISHSDVYAAARPLTTFCLPSTDPVAP